MKTAVDAIFVGKERAYNRRFQQMCAFRSIRSLVPGDIRSGVPGYPVTPSSRR